MKIPTVLSFLYVGNLLRDAHCSPLPELFAAKSMEEVEALMSKTKQRPAHEVLRGRRRLQDGTLETSNHILADRFGGEAGFFHSVASGDPLADAVIIWTRYTPVNVDDEITLEFRMAAIDPNLEVNAHLDPTLNENIKRGKVTVTAASDFTAKIDVTGLPSNTQFVYVFSDGQQVSDIGLTKTAPAPGDEDPDLIYAFFSCSHFTNGFFHAYDVASTIQDLDLWIHVGDYYYEYGLFDTYAREAAEQRDQFVLPIWETIDLQDYRNRHSTHVAHDEGLRNLRRRAPMIATWDDHETTNDSYGNVNQGTGAENHQETCLANATSPDADKAAAQCDRPEGDAVERFTAAAQAYWEWMPIRYVEGTMGEIQTGTLTQIIEWGDLATIASFDTRMSFRTEESTGASAFATYAAVGAVNTNVSSYSDPSSDAYAAIQQIRESDRGSRLNESFSMLGDYFDTLEDVFEASKAAGKPWQIWAANTMMGHYVLPDAAQFYLDAPEEVQAIIQTYFDAFMLSEAALTARLISALRVADIEWNLDDYGGFYAERAKITEMAKASTNNMVVLGGDLHDAFAWVLVEGGEVEGAPVAINLGCPSVTSPGFKNAFLPVFSPILEAIGGEDVAIDIMNRGYARANPNLKFSDIGKKGFVAIKATMDTHTAEYIGFSPETLLTDFATARTDGAITAPFECQISLTTQSDVPGSLEPSETCSAIAFDNERPAVYDLPVPSLDNMPEGDALTVCGMIGCAFDASTEPTDSASTVTPTAPAPAPASSSTLSIGRSMGLVTGVLLLIVTLL